MAGAGKYNFNAFLYFVIALALVLIVAPLFEQGLFIDGLLYKTVSTNYYTGDGSFWRMKFSNTSMNPFYEQPPFFFFVTGGFYKLFGNSHIVDKSVTLIFMGVSVALINSIYKLISGTNRLSLLIFVQLLSIPVVCWTFTNQVIETLVMPLSLLGLYCFLKYRETESGLGKITSMLCFSLTVVLLFLTKGFQSCFVAIVPFLYTLFFRTKKNLLFTLVSGVLIALSLYFFIFLYQPSAEWFGNYLQKRLVNSLEGVGATTTYRAEIIVRTLTELIVPIGVAILAWLFLRKRVYQKSTAEEKKGGFVILITALCGSLPFAITFEQRGFYLVPAFPFFVLAITLLFAPYLEFVQDKLDKYFAHKTIKYCSIGLMLVFLFEVFLGFYDYKRDVNLIKDLAIIKTHLKSNDTISIDGDSWNDTALQAYLYMQNKVSVEGNYNHKFYIHDRDHNTVPNENYKKVEIPTLQYDLFVRIGK